MPALFLNTFSFVTAACGLTYELVFAQSLTVLLGSSVKQYSLTIGVFLCGMGLGSQVSERLKNERLALFVIQAFLGAVIPLLFVALWAGGPLLTHAVLPPVCYSLVFTVGFANGMELPLLMRWSGEGRWRVLAFDYAGMLLACVAFPLLLLPIVGVFAAFFMAALLNSLLALALAPNAFARLVAAVVPPALALTLVFEESLREWLSRNFLASFL